VFAGAGGIQDAGECQDAGEFRMRAIQAAGDFRAPPSTEQIRIPIRRRTRSASETDPPTRGPPTGTEREETKEHGPCCRWPRLASVPTRAHGHQNWRMGLLRSRIVPAGSLRLGFRRARRVAPGASGLTGGFDGVEPPDLARIIIGTTYSCSCRR